MTALAPTRPPPALTNANRAALACVRAHAQAKRNGDLQRIARVLERAHVPVDIAGLLAGLSRGAVTMNFHPDRLQVDGRVLAQALYDEGAYRSQFETQTSNGSRTAYSGGERDQWEAQLFGDAYQQPGVSGGERPKYGGLNLMRYSNGACPRFGSCHLRLTSETLARATFCFGNSGEDPSDLSVLDSLEAVLAGLLEDSARGLTAPGHSGVKVAALVSSLLDTKRGRGSENSRAVDDYVEVQVHGPLLLTPDADAIVIDPSFAGSVAGDLLLATAARYGLAAEWSIGCALALADVPRHAPEIEPAGMRRWEAFCGRGRAFALAEYVIAGYGHGGCLDAATIGRANVSASRDLGVWREWGAGAAVQEQLKDLWLVLVAYGQPPQRPV